MLQENALRHQMVLPQQQKIYDYWRAQCKGGHLPTRYDIEPQFIKEHLPTVSLVELCHKDDKRRYKFRLAGTGFWDLFNAEITGRYIDNLPLGDRADYWTRVYDRVVDKGRPTAGLTRPGTPKGGHLAQFWIRMPLSTNGTDIDMVLGYDHLVKMSDVPSDMPGEHGGDVVAIGSKQYA